MFRTVKGYYQYSGGCSALWRDTISTVEDTIISYYRGCSVQRRDTIQYHAEYYQFYDGIPLVLSRIPSVLLEGI